MASLILIDNDFSIDALIGFEPMSHDPESWIIPLYDKAISKSHRVPYYCLTSPQYILDGLGGYFNLQPNPNQIYSLWFIDTPVGIEPTSEDSKSSIITVIPRSNIIFYAVSPMKIKQSLFDGRHRFRPKTPRILSQQLSLEHFCCWNLEWKLTLLPYSSRRTEFFIVITRVWQTSGF